MNEVSSKYKNKCIGLVIRPCPPANMHLMKNSELPKDNYIGVEDIAPLLLDRVIIKSFKEKKVDKEEDVKDEEGSEEDEQTEDELKKKRKSGK